MQDSSPLRSVRRWAWLAAAYAALALALAGVVLPVLPTTPFALIAAACAARGSERLYERLLAHRVLGPVIRDWSERRAVARRSKVVATATMMFSATLLLLLRGPGWVLLGTSLVMASVAVWLWRRDEPRTIWPAADDDDQGDLGRRRSGAR